MIKLEIKRQNIVNSRFKSNIIRHVNNSVFLFFKSFFCARAIMFALTYKRISTRLRVQFESDGFTGDPMTPRRRHYKFTIRKIIDN